MARVPDPLPYRQPLMAQDRNRMNSQSSPTNAEPDQELYKYHIPWEDALATYNVLSKFSADP